MHDEPLVFETLFGGDDPSVRYVVRWDLHEEVDGMDPLELQGGELVAELSGELGGFAEFTVAGKLSDNPAKRAAYVEGGSPTELHRLDSLSSIEIHEGGVTLRGAVTVEAISGEARDKSTSPAVWRAVPRLQRR